MMGRHEDWGTVKIARPVEHYGSVEPRNSSKPIASVKVLEWLSQSARVEQGTTPIRHGFLF